MRPTATSNISASRLTASPFDVLPVTRTPVSVFSSFSSFVSTCDLIPRLRKLRSSSFETSSSSKGTIGAKPRINRCELDTHSARAHHDQRLRHVFQLEDVIAIDHMLPVCLKSRDR